MEITSRMKMARFQTFWIQMWKNKPLDGSRKTGQTPGTKMAFYSSELLGKKDILDNKCTYRVHVGPSTWCTPYAKISS
ncbi:hypothetical protein Hanom_Chr05g00441011 [Helianthus anomalus]